MECVGEHCVCSGLARRGGAGEAQNQSAPVIAFCPVALALVPYPHSRPLARSVGPGRRVSAACSVLNHDGKQRAPIHPPPLFLFVPPKTNRGSLYIFPFDNEDFKRK
ncbi:hypothetical protein ElyMa_001625900 [Elysia marginata]|uniref:Uncharacterized protein n=1 Tax=Elysia marginata TaxID=1093978 RepID=A0AAV4JM89_9GAST|nr:hypothetical protein ElyMa_001625900 [Elysia marginata]